MMVRTLAVVLIILTAAGSRLLPNDIWNVSPVLAMALFGGAYLRNRILAFVIPLTAMLVSDVGLACFRYGLSSFRYVPFVYACVCLSVLLGWWVRSRRCEPVTTLSAALAGSILFYLITNFGVWIQQPWYPMDPPYACPMTLPGLVTCYINALPFFRPTLVGDMGFTIILFGGFWIAERIRAAGQAQPISAQSQAEEPYLE